MRPSQFVPSPALRAIDRVRTRRFLATTGPATVEYVRRNGLEVLHGPFEGMRYLDRMERSSGDLAAKLTGSYERELHGAIEEWIAAAPQHVVDIGCAEGYYAVGLAYAIEGATVHAFDIDDEARRKCDSLGRLNGVEERLRIGGECTWAALMALPERGVVLLSDCEGAELALLDPERAPRLRGWPILVELHDFVDPTVTETLVARFGATHEIEMIPSQARDGDRPPELAFMAARERSAVLSERRPGPMSWAHMRPRGAP